MRLPASAHTSRPWRIHEIAPDFRVLDVWALPTPGGTNDFPRLVEWATSLDPTKTSSPVVRALFEIRVRIGDLLGLDAPSTGVGARVTALRERLPADLRDRPAGPAFASVPFTSMYLTDNEFAAETANRTVHGVIHLGWVPDDIGGYRGQMAILVKPNGLLGNAYLAGIAPFRHLIVYPKLIRAIERQWRSEVAPSS